MKVEIWSDVMCPFCYIGKRRFEAAVQTFPDAGNIEVEWKSFQLNPNLVTDPSKKVHEYLAAIKGISVEAAKKMNDRVTQMAAASGLTYQMENAIVANSFDAHRLSHLAKQYNVQDALEEALFKAYFTDGKNTADHMVLTELAVAVGIPEEAVSALLNSKSLGEAVMRDVYEAQQIGVRGVPFFVFDRKYGISGAQEVSAFSEVLSQSFSEWKMNNNPLTELIGDAENCTPAGNCDIPVN